MKNIQVKILKYFINNDNGEYIEYDSLISKYGKEKIIKNINDLGNYLETESIYKYRGIITTDSKINKDHVLKAQITQEGREYYYKSKCQIGSLRIQKWLLWWTIVLVIIGIITVIFNKQFVSFFNRIFDY